MKQVFFLLLFLAAAVYSYGQCGCPGGIPISIPPATVGGTTDVGAMDQNVFRALTFFRYGTGNQNYAGDSKTSQGPVRSSSSAYAGLLIGYGIISRLTLEAELGYFIQKKRDEYYYPKLYSFSSNGLSDVVLSAKYNIYKNDDGDLEYTAGIGGRIPVSKENKVDKNYDNMLLPQYMQPSTGAYALVLHSFLHRDFYKQGFHFFLMNRFELSGENQNSYTFGPALFSSVYFTKLVLEDVTAMVELRNEFRTPDKHKDEKGLVEEVENSGSNIFYISPQINYNWGSFNISAALDIPFYQYYKGEQLGSKYAFAVNLSYITNLGSGNGVPVPVEGEEDTGEGQISSEINK